MISFTSGSTGEPKGVCRSEKSLTNRREGIAPELPLTLNDRFPILESMSVGVSVDFALHTLFAGAQVGIFDMNRLGLGTTLRLLGEFRPTVYSVVPSTFRALFGRDDAEIAGLAHDVRWVRLSGDPVQHSDVDLYRRRFPETCRLLVAIGASEAGTYASWYIDHVDTA